MLGGSTGTDREFSSKSLQFRLLMALVDDANDQRRSRSHRRTLRYPANVSIVRSGVLAVIRRDNV